MEIGKAYRISKSSTDGTFCVGDIVWKSENGDINSVAASGWITPNEVGDETLDFDCEATDDYKVRIVNNSRQICYKVTQGER